MIIKNILVTGGAGFIGSNFVRYILEADYSVRVINLDLLTYAGRIENLADLSAPSRHVFVEGNICDYEGVNKLFNTFDIDTVVHFAAETHVDRSIIDPAPFIQTNVTGTYILLEAARKAWANEINTKRFHHISTDEVYGELDIDDAASTESTPYNPRSPYSASKAASDYLVRSYFHTYGMHITITNCSNNYGPYQFPEKLIPFVILNALQGKTLPIYGDGKHLRDWLYVKDHCEAIHHVIENGKSGETYNVGAGNQVQNIDLVKQICSILDELKPTDKPYASQISYVPDRQGHDRRYSINSEKILSELGWSPKYDIKTGLQETVKWYVENPEWMKMALDSLQREKWYEKNYLNRGST